MVFEVIDLTTPKKKQTACKSQRTAFNPRWSPLSSSASTFTDPRNLVNELVNAEKEIKFWELIYICDDDNENDMMAIYVFNLIFTLKIYYLKFKILLN